MSSIQTRNLIAGEWVGADGPGFSVLNPATDEVVARVPDCGAAGARQAIDAAAAAFPAWCATPAAERAGVLRRFSDHILRDRDALARLMTAEQGKPLAEARGEVTYAASFVEWSAEEARRVYGETIPASAPDKRILVLRQPVGVTAAITPWNFPAAMITRKLGPALAAGCTMIVKPAEQTPLTALALGALAVEAGIPPGVVNIITGRPQAIGGALFDDPRVRKVSFTGSTEVGRILISASARNVTRLSLELGGHAPMIVFDDADLDAAVAAGVGNKFRNAGQTCICVNRFLVQEGIYERFLEALAAAAAGLRIGPGTEGGVQVGPLIDDSAVAKVKEHVADALGSGATLACGGTTVRPRPGLADRFYAPTVLAGVRPGMLVAREETFGPVAPLIRFRTEAEAIALANDTPYGLAAYFFTRDAARAWRVAEALEAGIVGINDAAPSTAQAPFGGVKQSGFGREGGRQGMDEYTDLKYVSWGGIAAVP